MRFRLTSRSITLDFEFSPNFAEFCRFGRQRMTIDPYCQRRFQRCIDYVDIAGRSSARGRQTVAGWENISFEQNA